MPKCYLPTMTVREPFLLVATATCDSKMSAVGLKGKSFSSPSGSAKPLGCDYK